MTEPVADRCDFAMQCQYKEAVGLGTRKRWWELAVGSTLFYLTRSPQSMAARYDTGEGWMAFSTVYKQRLRYVPVKLVSSSQAPTDQVQIPRLVTVTLRYHQSDAQHEHMVSGEVEYDTWWSTSAVSRSTCGSTAPTSTSTCAAR